MLKQIQIEHGQKKPLDIKNLVDLVLYVQTLNAKHFSSSNRYFECGFNHPQLIEIHKNNSCLYIDKYLETSIPDVQTEFLLESQGFSPCDYDGYLGKPDKDGVVRDKFWVNFCQCDSDKLSEVIIPIIDGGRLNPCVRLNSAKISGCIQLNKISDLVGFTTIKPRDDLDIDAMIENPTIFNLMVFTFPFDEVGIKLLHPRQRAKVIKKMWKCYKLFFKELRFVFGLDPSMVLGSNVSLHLWSSKFPFLPHPHFHVILPHFSYLNVTKMYRAGCEFVIPDVYDNLYNAEDKVLQDFYKTQVDEHLKDLLYFTKLEHFGKTLEGGKKLPLDVSLIKFIWSDIVNQVFNIETSTEYDVYTEFVKSSNKNKLQHYLQYKNRPVILDLDLFFRKCQGFINGYGSDDINLDVVHDFIQSEFVNAVMKNRDLDIVRYETTLVKFERILKEFSKKDVFSWLQFLSTLRTETRIFGFWKNLKRYRITSVERGPLPKNFTCPLCGSELIKAIGCNELYVDFVIVNNRSRFEIYNISVDGG